MGTPVQNRDCTRSCKRPFVLLKIFATVPVKPGWEGFSRGCKSEDLPESINP